MVTLPLEGRMVGGIDRYPPANEAGLKFGLLNWSCPPETDAMFRSVPLARPTESFGVLSLKLYRWLRAPRASCEQAAKAATASTAIPERSLRIFLLRFDVMGVNLASIKTHYKRIIQNTEIN